MQQALLDQLRKITDEERRICFEVLEKICKNVEKITGGE